MTDVFDLVVIGSGTAAQVASARVRAAGWRVAVADHRPFGGTCALRGCDPKKMLVSGAEAIDAARRMRTHGIEGDLRIEWPALLAFKRTFTAPTPSKHERRYADRGIETVRGRARFTGPDTVLIDGMELKARHILFAAGARPVALGIPGDGHVITSDDFLELDVLPERIAMVGGGYIAAELSHVAARAGAQVTVLQRSDRLLPQFDGDVVGWLMESFETLGIDVRTRTAVQRIAKTAQGFVVYAAGADGQEQAIEVDLVVHAAGRTPDLDPLDLTAAGVETERGRLRLNEFLQSVSNPRVYAAGDAAASGLPLTPVSSHDAKVVAASIGRRTSPAGERRQAIRPPAPRPWAPGERLE